VKPESWSFASGAAVAREAAFLPGRAIEELAVLSPQEVSTRLSRTWFGPAEPLPQFDRLASERRAKEFEYFEKISPGTAPVDLLRLGLAADRLRAGLAEIPDAADAGDLAQGLAQLAIRAGRFHEEFREELSPPLPSPEPSARLAAALLIDSAELAIGERIAAGSGEAMLQRWAEARTSAMAGKVGVRALRLGMPKDPLFLFFFRDRILPDRARDLRNDYREQTALRLYPPGCEPGREEAFLLGLAGESKGQPFSAAVVLRYLLGYLEQERLIRLAVYAALGKTLKREAA
jgi:hypothetical protein